MLACLLTARILASFVSITAKQTIVKARVEIVQLLKEEKQLSALCSNITDIRSGSPEWAGFAERSGVARRRPRHVENGAAGYDT
jgi:hypothetical protein